jgi:glycosyltransferase involved in cell wall biosynthesis
MLSFQEIIPLAAREAGDKPIVAAPYPLPEIVCRGLIADGLIGGYIADDCPKSPTPDPFIAGWWTNHDHGSWFIRSAMRPTLMLLSGTPQHEISGRMLLEARLKGIRRMLFVGDNGAITNRIDVAAALNDRLQSVEVAQPIHRLSYAEMFEDIYALLGDRLRLPPSAFDPDMILLMSGSLDPGGAERQVTYTATGLGRRFPGHVHVARTYTGPSRDFFKPMIESAGVRLWALEHASPDFEAPDIIEIRNTLTERYGSLGVQGIFDLIFHHALLFRRARPGLVHTWLDFCNVLAGLAADLVGVPRLVLSGRSVAPDNFSIFQPYMAPAYLSMFKRREPVFLNNSQAGADDYARWLGLPRERFSVVHNAFEFPEPPANARQSVRDELGIPADAPVIGSIIRFGEEKRPALMLDIAEAVHRTHPNARFVVFGAGPLLEQCRARVSAAGLTDVIKLPGLTSNAFVALAAMDVFVLTSRMEGLPNVLIEAQASGLPVICSGAGGMKETFVHGETGFVVESADAEDMAQAVRGLLDDPVRRERMGARAREHAHAAFGMERMVDETIAAYRRAIPIKSDFAALPRWSDPTEQIGFRLCGIRVEQGECFVAKVAGAQQYANWQVWEDDTALGAGGDLLAEVRQDGRGRYRIDGDDIFFSTSDGTDPRFNGRTYRLRSAEAEAEFDDIPIGPSAIHQEVGFCHIADLGLGEGSGHFTLWEDNQQLGPDRCLHDDIRTHGEGRYCVWHKDLYFSSSDGSDPRTNGRTYVLRRRKVALHSEDRTRPASLPLDQALRHISDCSVPREDFVPGRIVHVVGSLGPGGAERQILYTLRGLTRSSFESAQLLCYHLESANSARQSFYLPDFIAAGIPVRALRRHTGASELANMPGPLRDVAEFLPANLAPDIADLYWEFIELCPEVVHAWLDWTNERVAFAAALAGVPRIIVSGRNMNPTYFPFYEPYMDVAYRVLLDLPQVTMINNTAAGRDDYAQWLGVDARRIPVIYNGVDFGAAQRSSRQQVNEARRKLGLREDAFVVGGVFRFAAEKRPLLWIEAAAELVKTVPNAQFILFGSGHMMADMVVAIEQYGLKEHVIFGGITNNILETMSLMNVFLLTSMVEGIPNVVLEAEWVGTPVVATRAGGAGEAVEQGVTGWIVDPPDAAAIAARVKWLHDEPAVRVACEEQGPLHVKRKFGMARMVEDTVRVYRLAGSDTVARW